MRQRFRIRDSKAQIVVRQHCLDRIPLKAVRFENGKHMEKTAVFYHKKIEAAAVFRRAFLQQGADAAAGKKVLQKLNFTNGNEPFFELFLLNCTSVFYVN